MIRALALLLVFLIASRASVFAETAEAPEVLVVGIVGTESSSNIRKGFEPFLQELSKKIGIPIKAYFASDYAGVVEAMRFNKIQLAWFGNKSAMEAVDRAEGEVFAQITNVDGSLGYHSLLIAHRESELTSVDDVIARRGELTFGNGDPNSTSGFLVPGYYLWSPRGVDPLKDFKRTRSANHEVNCLAVAMKQVDVATANDQAIERLRLARPEMADRLKILWKSPTIPSDPLVWRKDLPRHFKAQLKAALLGFGRFGPNAERELALLAGIQEGWGPMLDSSNDQLLPIRELELAKRIQFLESDPRLSASEKASRLEEARAELERLRSHIESLEAIHGVKR